MSNHIQNLLLWFRWLIVSAFLLELPSIETTFQYGAVSRGSVVPAQIARWAIAAYRSTTYFNYASSFAGVIFLEASVRRSASRVNFQRTARLPVAHRMASSTFECAELSTTVPLLRPFILPDTAPSKAISSAHCAAILFLNSLSRCLLCNSNLSTAYFSLAFFCSSLLNSSASFPAPASLFLAPLLRLLCRLVDPAVVDDRLWDSRPSCNSAFARSDSSRRESRSMWLEARVRRWVMLGVISSRRDCCAAWRVGSGRSSKCLRL